MAFIEDPGGHREDPRPSGCESAEPQRSRRAARRPKRVCSTDQSITRSFAGPHHPLTRKGFARTAGVKVPKNRAVTRLGSWDSGRNPDPQAILRLVGALRIHGEIRQYELYATYTRSARSISSRWVRRMVPGRAPACRSNSQPSNFIRSSTAVMASRSEASAAMRELTKIFRGPSGMGCRADIRNAAVAVAGASATPVV